MIPGGFQLLGFPPPNQATFDRKASQIQTYWEKARVGCFKRTALKHVYYLG